MKAGATALSYLIADYLERLSFISRKRAIWLKAIQCGDSDADIPNALARGTAAGLFVACTPTIFQMPLAIIMGRLIKGDLTAAFISCWIMNPLTMGPIYSAELFTGLLLTGHRLDGSSSDIAFAFAVGSITVASAVSAIGFCSIYLLASALARRPTERKRA